MYDFRTKEMYEAYEDHKKTEKFKHTCPLCTEDSIKEFTYWRIIQNDFPYDRIAKTHHMLVPKRHVREESFTQEEKDELLELKRESLEEYFYIVEAHPQKKSLPEHFHLHLLIPKDLI